jgi:hypothetical protein
VRIAGKSSIGGELFDVGTILSVPIAGSPYVRPMRAETKASEHDAHGTHREPPRYRLSAKLWPSVRGRSEVRLRVVADMLFGPMQTTH